MPRGLTVRRRLARFRREPRQPLEGGDDVHQVEGHVGVVGGEARAPANARRPEEVLRGGPVEARKVDAHAHLASLLKDDDRVGGPLEVALPMDGSSFLQLGDFLDDELLLLWSLSCTPCLARRRWAPR